MNKSILSLFCLLINFPLLCVGQQIFENEDLTATVVEPGVTVLETRDKTTLYLVEGDSEALLIDTGTDIKDLDKIIGQITNKPYRVVATHGHYDHVGNVDFFKEFYMHPADNELDTEAIKNYKGIIHPLADGDVFDLGQRKVKVVHTPGHTPGSVSLVDYENGMAFTGDAFGSGQLWMQLNPQVDFSNLIESTGKMIEEMSDNGIEKLYVGHYPYLKKPLDISYLVDVNIAARMIDEGEIEGATRFDDKAMVMRHGNAEIVFLPEVAGKKTRKRQNVLFKFDDLHYGDNGEVVPPHWYLLFDYIKENNLPTNIGIIGYSLDGEYPEFFNLVKDLNRYPNIEFWSHGYHERLSLDEPGEFETDLDTQKRAVWLTDSLAKTNLDITLRGWGPHWTDCNQFTDEALSTVPDIRMIFSHPTLHEFKYYDGKVLEPNLEMEYPFFNPVYDLFIVNYLGKWRNLDTFFLQGHPNEWTEERWEEFKKIHGRLKDDNANFITISEYIDL